MLKNNDLIVYIIDNFFNAKIKEQNNSQIVYINIIDSIEYIKNHNTLKSIILIPTIGKETFKLLSYLKEHNLFNILTIKYQNTHIKSIISNMILSFFNIVPINNDKAIKEQHNNAIIEKEIEQLLLDLGASPKLKGYYYVRDAIYKCILLNNEIKIEKDLYSYLSKKYQKKISAIDSAIRRLIYKVMENAPWDIKYEYFSTTIYNNDEENNPSNGLFIKTLSQKFIMNIKLKKENTLFL